MIINSKEESKKSSLSFCGKANILPSPQTESVLV